MLRRTFSYIKPTVTSSSLLSTRCAYSVTSLRLHNNKVNPETARQASQEDHDELERERKLREQFASKINSQYQNTSNASANSATGSGSSPIPPFPGFKQAWNQAWEQAGQQASQRQQQQQQQQHSQSTGEPTTNQKIARLFFFAGSIYLIMIVSNMRNPNSPLMVLQGVPWWQVPTDTVLTFSLIRLLVSVREQRSIKTDFEAAAKQEPHLSLPQFLNRRYPTVLAGHRTLQAEILAALSACHIATRDFKVSDTIYRVVREKGVRDPKTTIDALMDGLRNDFPQVFAPQQQQSYQMAPPQQTYSIGQISTSNHHEDGLRVDMTAGQVNNSEFKSM